MNNRPRKKLLSSLGIASLATAGAFGGLIATAAPASAATCGYYEEIEQRPASGWVFAVGGQSADLFGAQQQVSHYGHCGPTNVLIRVDMESSNTHLCVSPGHTRLGLATGWNEITNAYYVGLC